MTTKIYIATHKIFNEPNKQGYIPLHVGASLHSEKFYLSDNTADSISFKNRTYCELTGLYWIWKNTSDENIGLVHYRRYFTYKDNYGELLSSDDIDELLKTYDIILPEKKYLNFNTKVAYWISHNLKDYNLLYNICEEKFPEYVDDFKWFNKQKSFYAYNMFIGKKEIMNRYFEWLFPLLSELEKRHDISKYDVYQSRVYGFLAERMFNIWIHHQNLKVQEIPVINIEENNKVYKKDTYNYPYRYILFRIKKMIFNRGEI